MLAEIVKQIGIVHAIPFLPGRSIDIGVVQEEDDFFFFHVDHTQLFGVDTFIEKIKDDIFAPQGAWVISLCGEGGLGKTAITYEAVARYAAPAGFTRVGWVS